MYIGQKGAMQQNNKKYLLVTVHNKEEWILPVIILLENVSSADFLALNEAHYFHGGPKNLNLHWL